MPLKVVPRRDRKLHRLVKKGETVTLSRGEILFKQGDSATDLVLVRTGHLRFTTHPETQGVRVIAVAGPWEMAGEEGLFPGTVRRTEARAGEPTMVTFLDGKGVNRALRTASKTYGAFLKAKEEELILARTLAGPKRAGSAARNLAAVLLRLSGRIGRVDETEGIRIPIRLSHKVLADLCGCHRSTVTTQLNEWIYEGVLRQKEGLLWLVEGHALAEFSPSEPTSVR